MKLNKIVWILSFMFLISLSFVSATLDSDNTVAYWALENLSDSTPNNYDLTNFGATSGVTGVIDDAYNFDGSNDYIDTNLQNIGGTNGAYTVSLWVNFNAKGAGGVFDGFTTTHNFKGVLIRNTATGISFFHGDGTDWNNWDYATTDITNWIHVVQTYDGSTNVERFINGVSVHNDTVLGFTESVSDYVFGCYRTSGVCSTYTSFDLDEVAVFNYSLDSSDVSELYSSGSPDSEQQYPFTSPVVTVNDSTESTAVVKQVGSISFSGGAPTTIFSSDFNITYDDTPLYGGYTFKVASNGNNEMFCELLINGTSYGNVTRTQYAGETAGNAKISFPIQIIPNNGTYNQALECSRTSGTGLITISNAVGVGHFQVDQDGNFLNYNSSTITKTVTSGSSYTLLDSLNITIGNKTNTSAVNPRKNHIVIDGSFTYTNNGVVEETPQIYASVNGTNCTMLPRTTDVGGVASVSYDCHVYNVTENATYQIDFYGNGTNILYEGNVIAKNFFLSYNEIIGGTGILTGATFSGDTYTTLISGVEGGNNNHDLANVFNKLSYSITTDVDTTVSIYFNITNGGEYLTNVWQRDFLAGKTGVMIGQDVIEGLPKDDYNVSLHANCGTVGATCTISGGQTGGYLTDVVTTIVNSFDVTAYNNWTNESLINFNVTDGATVTSVNGTATYFSTNTYENLTISAINYFDTYIPNHNTSLDLNVSMRQSDIKFRSTEIITGDYVAPANFTVDGVTKGVNESFYLTEGTYNVTFSKSGWYNSTQEINITALDNKTIIVTDVSDSIINITAKHLIDNNTLTNFTGWIYEETSDTNISFSTTTGYSLVSAASNTTFQIYLQSEGYTSSLNSFTVNNTPVFNHTEYLYKYNSFYINFYDELTLNKITTENITLDLISDTYSNNYSTSNGTLYITLLDPESYILEYGATNYNTRSYFITLNDDTTEALDLYLLSNTSDYETITVTVVDEAPDPIEGLTVIVQKYFVETNSYENVAQQKTDFNGISLFDLDTEGTFFKFVVVNDAGTILKETEPAKLTSTSFILTILQDEIDGEQYIQIVDDYINIQNSLTFNNETNNFRLFYSIAGGVSKTICLKVEKYSILGNTDIDTSCATGSTATILVPITPINGSSYLATAYISSNNQEINRKLETFNTNPSFSREGLLAQLILIILAIGIGITTPKWLPVTVTTSLWLGSIMRLHSLGFDVCSGLLVAGIIITYYLERN